MCLIYVTCHIHIPVSAVPQVGQTSRTTTHMYGYINVFQAQFNFIPSKYSQLYVIADDNT